MVNASWNIGALMARCEKNFIVNDDVNFNPEFLGYLFRWSLEHIGIAWHGIGKLPTEKR